MAEIVDLWRPLLTFWDGTAHKEVRSLRDAGPVWSVAIPDGGKVLASGSSRNGGPSTGGGAKLWDLATGKELVAFDWQCAWVKSVAFTLDGKTLPVGGGGEVRL
jgi:WD40 repeat protein